MGGVPAILLVIAAGIIYGWQPDGDGGVEYIIQVPPDQIERLQQTGEITSVIAPEVQGHVSRVILRVGTGTLPRETPANLLGRTASLGSTGGHELGASDVAPIPIPEMVDLQYADPIAGIPLDGALNAQELLKPDTNSPAPPSTYNFPGLPPALRGTTPQIDQAGREFTNTAGVPGTTVLGPAPQNPNITRVAPPATRTVDSGTSTMPPPFTGSDPQGDYARTRVGGPSTDPTPTRDSTWSGYPASSPPTSFAAPLPTAASSASGQVVAGQTTGVAPGDTFGSMPTGMSLSRNTSASSPAAGPPAANPAASVFGANTYPYGASTQGSQTSPAATVTNPASLGEPDPRLTQAELASGAWSIDEYGRIYDRQGRLLSPPPARSNTVSQPNLVSQPNGATLSNNLPDPPSSYDARNRFNTEQQFDARGNFASRDATGQLNVGAMDHVTQPGPETPARRSPSISFATESFATDRADDPASLSDRDSISKSRGLDNREVVAPQPLFNGLLLISLVANVYLIFWLKNLRIQFRELVTAKRMASSNGQ